MRFFFFVAEIELAIKVFVIDSDGFKVVFDHFASSIFLGSLVAEVGF